MESIFPKEMLQNELNLDTIVSKLTYFQEQIHLIHWQTSSYAEHKALGSLYEYIQDFRDDLVEKLMGYTGKKPGIYKLIPLGIIDCKVIVSDLISFAQALKKFGEKNMYQDVCNLADSLSGEAAKTRYLLNLT